MALKLQHVVLPVVAAGGTELVNVFGTASAIDRRIKGLWGDVALAADLLVYIDREEVVRINTALTALDNQPIPCDVLCRAGQRAEVGYFDRAGAGLAAGATIPVLYEEAD